MILVIFSFAPASAERIGVNPKVVNNCINSGIENISRGGSFATIAITGACVNDLNFVGAELTDHTFSASTDMSTQTITPQRHWWRDMALILVLTLTYFWLATRGDWSERISRFLQLNEAWQLDEFPLTLLLLSLGLCWFSWRRTQEFRQELARRRYAETQVQGLAAHNKDLSQQLLRTQENERQALARELHDEFGQHCTAIRAEAQFIHNAVSQTEPAADLQRIALSARHINDSAEDLYSMVRDMLTRLRPPTLDSLGLEFALQELCEEWEKKTDIAVVFCAHNVRTDRKSVV